MSTEGPGNPAVTDHQLRETVERLADLVDGNEAKDIKGLRRRVLTLEEWSEDMKKKWNTLSALSKGIVIGLGINLLGTALVLLTIMKLAGEVGRP